MDGRSSAAPSSLTSAVSFPEENSVVLDKWLMDVCGEEDLQFPSHRRAQYPTYIDRLRRVSKARQFIANTFDYPSRSGTREVLVLQKTLEALGVEEQALRHAINQVHANVARVRRVLDERTMGASSIVEEEKAQAVKLAEMQAEEKAKKAAIMTPAKQQMGMQQQQQGHTPVSASTPTTPSPQPSQTATKPESNSTTNATTTTAVTTSPVPVHGADDVLSTASTSASSRLVAKNNTTPTATTVVEQNTLSAVARAARRADYEKKKALSVRYMEEVQSKTQTAAGQRAEIEERYARLLKEKEQLDKEYEALQTTEELVVARHEEAAAHEHEETAQLHTEVAAYAVEESAFERVWDEMEEDGDADDAATDTDPTPAMEEVEARSGVEASITPPATAEKNIEDPPMAEQAPADHDGRDCQEETAVDATTASVSLTPAEHDESPPEITLHTHRPLSQDSSSSPSARSPSPVERAILEHDEEEQDEAIFSAKEVNELDKATEKSEQGAAALPPPQTSTSFTTARDKEARRAQLEKLRLTLSELGAVQHACRRQLLSTSQTHMGRIRQSQQRLHDWQEMAVRVRATYHQLQGQVAVINTVLQDTTARLDRDNTEHTYAQQLAKLKQLLRERSYDALQYYMGSGEEAATDMMLDANAEEELQALHRPSPSAAAGGMTPVRGLSASTASSVTPTRESSISGAYHTPRRMRSTAASMMTPSPGGGLDAPHRHRSRYELVRHLQRWEAALLADRLAILEAAHMTPGPFSGAGANQRRAEGFNAMRCYQELRHFLIQAKPTNGSVA